MAWFILIVAGALEVVWSLGLKYTQGFTRPLPALVTMAAAHWLNSRLLGRLTIASLL